MKAECSRRKLRVRVYHTPHINVASLIQRGEGGREGDVADIFNSQPYHKVY